MRCKLREPASGLTHAVGLLISIGALALMVTIDVRHKTVWHVVSDSIFGSSLILLYAASTLYHLLPLKEKGINLLRQIDHTMIFILIAGTYTPFCLVTMRGPWGWSMFGIIWGLAAAGIITRFVWKSAPRLLRVAFYIIMGWLSLVMIYPLSKAALPGTLTWLFIGGLFYTVGALFYALKWPNPLPEKFGFHEIWHLFVMGGSLSHIWTVLRYV
ncbi:MAG: hemolysin III family protein [Deltaproteobacteria bacterium]|nr:hemolysin III family protein [Candidatus Anaeroferrophillus wilburensis]MBN2889251.1 hemolysin III family protein [Deltaproteobacteria bacterium]